jgi:hypothetical protein
MTPTTIRLFVGFGILLAVICVGVWFFDSWCGNIDHC